jgi:hypothetical protein
MPDQAGDRSWPVFASNVSRPIPSRSFENGAARPQSLSRGCSAGALTVDLTEHRLVALCFHQSLNGGQ